MVHQESVVSCVIQATGTVKFKKGLRMEVYLKAAGVIVVIAMSIRLTPTDSLVAGWSCSCCSCHSCS